MTRLVMKLGSSSIASGEGLALDVIADLVTQIANAQRAGHEVVLVTSGAARLGTRLLAFEGPTARAGTELQRVLDAVRLTVSQAAQASGDFAASAAPASQPDPAEVIRSLESTLERYGTASLSGPLGVALAASVGQPALMALYRQLASAVGMEVCQILLSKSDLDSAEAMRDVGSVLISALRHGLLPIVNGNDTTDPKAELDNDQIAVAVAVAAEASRLTFLTNVRAVYGDTEMQDRITRLTPEEARALRISAPGEGRGGMRSKLNAAARAAYCGVECVIGSARDSDVVARSLSPRARMGTVIRAASGPLPSAERWVGGIAYRMGTIGINREAEVSLRAGSTLFLSGVKRIDGEFEPGAVVELVDVRHPERLIGRGSVAMPASILRLLRALSPDESADVLSIVFRLRHAPAPRGAEAGGQPALRADLLDPGQYDDVADLTRRGSQAARQAHAELSSATPERVRTLTDALLQAQPRACSAILAEGSFLAGKIGSDSAVRRAIRDMHAIHRDSLVVFSAS
ncbi:MAG TPA: PUA domain-containing protein [Streptosporangiaceae bacterium]